MVMTKQEAYDTICAGLAKQKRRSYDGDKCMFRGPDGLKCAAGHLIPDSKYLTQMDVGGLSVLEVLRMAGLPEEIRPLVSGLQQAHDIPCDAGQLRQRFRAEASRYGVTPGAEEAITEWVV